MLRHMRSTRRGTHTLTYFTSCLRARYASINLLKEAPAAFSRRKEEPATLCEQRSPWSCSSQKISTYIWLIRPDFNTNLDRSLGQQSRLWSRNDTSSTLRKGRVCMKQHDTNMLEGSRNVCPTHQVQATTLKGDFKETQNKLHSRNKPKQTQPPAHNTPTKAPRNKQKQKHSGHQPEDRRTAKANQPHKDQTDGTTARLVVVLP